MGLLREHVSRPMRSIRVYKYLIWGESFKSNHSLSRHLLMVLNILFSLFLSQSKIIFFRDWKCRAVYGTFSCHLIHKYYVALNYMTLLNESQKNQNQFHRYSIFILCARVKANVSFTKYNWWIINVFVSYISVLNRPFWYYNAHYLMSQDTPIWVFSRVCMCVNETGIR